MTDYIKYPGHPLANGKNRVPAHQAALYAKIGDGIHDCRNCDKPLFWASGNGPGHIKVGYVDSDRTNLNPDNLFPICSSCILIQVNPKAIKPGEVVFVNKHGRRERGVECTCTHCGKNFTVGAGNKRLNPKVGTYCSGSCRSIANNVKRWAKAKA